MSSNLTIDAAERSGAGGGAGPHIPHGGDRWGSGPSGAVPQRAYMTGMILALGAILMFFAALVSAYIVRRGLSTGDWQPFALPRILWLNTLILVGSSFTLIRAHRSFLAQDTEGFRHFWGVTATLGVFFLAGQIIAWRQLVSAGLFLAANPAASFFYVFTVAHALHLLGGIAALVSVEFRTLRHLTLRSSVEIVSLYWHFMDALWLFLFMFLAVSART